MITRELLEGLFDEKKIRILGEFYSNPKEEFYLRELSRRCNVPVATTYRILNRLADLELVRVKSVKKTKFYILGRSEGVDALRPFFEEKKDPLKEFVTFAREISGVNMIILHEKKNEDKKNILLIGDGLDSASVEEKVAKIKNEFEISLVVLTLTEEQFERMSVMGLFPGKRRVLWEK